MSTIVSAHNRLLMTSVAIFNNMKPGDRSSGRVTSCVDMFATCCTLQAWFIDSINITNIDGENVKMNNESASTL